MQIGLYHSQRVGIRRIVSEDSIDSNINRWPFLLIACTERIVTACLALTCLRPGHRDQASTVGYSGVPAYSRILQLRVVHSYGRRLPGLRLRASPCGLPTSLTYRHRAGVRPYTSSCELAGSCVFDKQSQKPIYCDPQELLTRKCPPPRAPLIANLRGHFAEFLNQCSPERLRLLVSPTCVSFSTVTEASTLRSFSRAPFG
jgi:hypothetical protein